MIVRHHVMPPSRGVYDRFKRRFPAALLLYSCRRFQLCSPHPVELLLTPHAAPSLALVDFIRWVQGNRWIDILMGARRPLQLSTTLFWIPSRKLNLPGVGYSYTLTSHNLDLFLAAFVPTYSTQKPADYKFSRSAESAKWRHQARHRFSHL